MASWCSLDGGGDRCPDVLTARDLCVRVASRVARAAVLFCDHCTSSCWLCSASLPSSAYSNWRSVWRSTNRSSLRTKARTFNPRLESAAGGRTLLSSRRLAPANVRSFKAERFPPVEKKGRIRLRQAIEQTDDSGARDESFSSTRTRAKTLLFSPSRAARNDCLAI